MTDEVTTLPEGATSADATLAAALGSDFHPEPRDEQPPQAAAEPQTGAEQPEGSDGEQPAQDASVDSLTSLAERLGASMDDLMSLKATLKVDGEDKETTLGELFKINQLEGHVNRKSIELSEKQKAWEGEQQKVRGEWQQRVQFAGQVLDSQENQLAQQYHSINWQALQQQDPAQFSALYLQFQQAGQAIQWQKQQLAQHYQQTQAQMRDSLRPAALQAIHAKFPELNDPASYGNALGEMKAYLKGIGANESNFEALELDPVVFQVARDAARYAALAAQKPQVQAKVANAPKFEKSSPRGNGNNDAKANYDRAIRGDEDAMARLLAS